jgi:hypothetical protein
MVTFRGSGGPFFENGASPRSAGPGTPQTGSSLRGVLLVRSRVVDRDAHGCCTGAMQDPASELRRIRNMRTSEKTPSRDCLETPPEFHFVVSRARETERKGIFLRASRYQETHEPTRPPTFQTVSLRSTLAIWLRGRRHRSRVPWVLLRLFSGRCARATRKKSPCVLGVPTLPTMNGKRCPKGVWPRVWSTEASEEPLSERRELRGALKG